MTPGRTGVGARLLLAQVTVLGSGAVTAWAVAAIVGPPLFREHLHRAGVPAQSPEELHAEEAYGYATALSVGGALVVSALIALAVSWYLSRRLQRSVTEVASAAAAVTQGRYDVRVASPHLGDEFDALAEAFNEMAARLQTVDTTRRQLLGDLAHEIRTPVSVLEAYMEALEDGVRTLTPETTVMLRDQTRRLVRFSEDFAALAKAEESSAAMAFEWVNIAELVNNSATAQRERFAEKHVELIASVSSDEPQVWADPQRLAQVLGNLIENALRHTPPGGRVDISAGVDDHEMTLRVADTGEGIPEEHLPHLFERFYRVDAARHRDHGGAGIGLAIAKALVHAHSGTISAASDGPGRGTTFTIVLPLRATTSSRESPASS